MATTISRYMCQSILLWCAIISLSWGLLTAANLRSAVACAIVGVYTPSVFGSISGGETTRPSSGTGNAGQITKATGWAAFSERNARGGFVVVTTGADTQIIAAATVGSAKTAWLAEYYHQPALAFAGWEAEIPAVFLQPGPNRIRAWLCDPVDESYRLLHDPAEPVFQLAE